MDKKIFITSDTCVIREHIGIYGSNFDLLVKISLL